MKTVVKASEVRISFPGIQRTEIIVLGNKTFNGIVTAINCDLVNRIVEVKYDTGKGYFYSGHMFECEVLEDVQEEKEVEYVMLKEGEVIKEGDEVYDSLGGVWDFAPDFSVGSEVAKHAIGFYRRKVKSISNPNVVSFSVGTNC